MGYDTRMLTKSFENGNLALPLNEIRNQSAQIKVHRNKMHDHEMYFSSRLLNNATINDIDAIFEVNIFLR